MKNKIIAILLVLSLVIFSFSLAGCKEKSAAELFNSAVEKIDRLSSMELKLSMKVTAEIDGAVQTVPVDALVKSKNMLGENPIVYALVKTEMAGQKNQIESYLEGDWVYVVEGEDKYKIYADGEGEAFDYIDELDDVLEEIPANAFSGATVKDNNDGSKTITLTVTNNKFCEIYEDLVENFASNGETLLEITNNQIIVTVKNGYIQKYSVDFSFKEKGKSDKEKTDVSVSAEFVNVGKKPKITPPEGYKNFEHKH